jgi:hypothetical protein
MYPKQGVFTVEQGGLFNSRELAALSRLVLDYKEWNYTCMSVRHL